MRASSALLTTVCLGAACLAAPVQSNNQTITFGKCPTTLAAPGFECGNLTVAMDWQNPSNGKTIMLGISRIPARDQSRRIGNLFYNPGGPGVLVSQILHKVATGGEKVKAEILDQFDLIGVDLRGTGLSTPISCSEELYNALPILYASTPESYDTLLKHNLAFRQSCLDKTGSDLIDYMDTVSIVHDHEAVRQALGGEKLTWLGQSYGTLLASQYAELYAENVRGMVLDGSISNSQEETAQFVQAGQSVEAELNFFFTWCEQASVKDCPLKKEKTKSVSQIWDDLMAKAAQSPIPGARCGPGKNDCVKFPATPLELRIGVHQLQYAQSYFPFLADAIYEAAFKNDATYLLSVSIFVAKDWNTYNASQAYANVAISCQDFNHTSSATMLNWLQQIAKYDMPRMRGVSAALWFLHQCVGWPQPERNPPHVISIPDTLSSKVLLVTNVYDPATPSSWSVELQQEIGEDRAVLISREKAGHTVWLEPAAFDGPTVAAMNHYLLTLETPPQRTSYDN